MKHNIYTLSSHDGLNLNVQQWIPETKPKAVIQIVHGFADHSERYKHVGEFLASKEFCVVVSDLRGHGTSEGIRGHVDKFTDLLKDQELITQRILEEFDSVPLFLLGHSIGSIISLHYLLAGELQNRFKGLILSGSGLELVLAVPRILFKIIGPLSKLLPKLKIDANLQPLQMSRDPEIINSYGTDPLIFKKGTLRMGYEIFAAIEDINPRLSEITIPLLSFRGDKDTIWNEAREQFEMFSSADKTYKEFAECLHECLNESEPERTEVLTLIQTFIEERI
jgi:acylglycerol lipase